MNIEKADLASFSLSELKTWLAERDQPAFRGDQLYRWLHKTPVDSFQEMTNLSKPLRELLSQQAQLFSVNIEKKLVSSIDGTVKYLYRLHDGNFVETVVMRYRHGTSICISTQVGCKMGCSFCASTKAGFVRNLRASEMLWEIYRAEQDLGESIHSVVLMGIGEPMDNYDNVLRFLQLLSSPEGRGLSLRHVSLSTCGVVPMIDRLAEERLQLTLSISLHAAFNEKRDELMPVNRRYPLKELLAACRRYTEKTGRRISFEYILIDGVNDTPRDAEQLIGLLKGMLCHINLIPANGVKEWRGKGSKVPAANQFAKLLCDGGMNATIRRRMGSDIEAACGQLRREREAQKGGV